MPDHSSIETAREERLAKLFQSLQVNPADWRVLFTGITGFLGSNLARAVCRLGASVSGLLRASSSTHRIGELPDVKLVALEPWTQVVSHIRQCQPNIVIHCATDYGRSTRAFEVIDANVSLPLKLLTALSDEVGPKFHFINTDTILDKRVSHYSLSKFQFKQWLQLFSGHACLSNISLEHFYGPGDNQDKFVSTVLTALRRNQPTLDLTQGEQVRRFVYIDDVVEAFLYVLACRSTNATGYSEFQIAGDERTSIRQFVELARAICQSSTVLRFGALPYRLNEVMNPVIDLSAIHALGWRQALNIEHGLKATVRAESGT
jgi:CDP-paratose synthetase